MNKQSRKQDVQRNKSSVNQDKNYESKERKNSTQCIDGKDNRDCKD